MNQSQRYFVVVCVCFALLVLAGCSRTGVGYGLERAGRYIRTGTAVVPPAAKAQMPDKQGHVAEVVKPKAAPVKIGILLPLTGEHAQLGQAMLNAAQLALFNVAHDEFSLVPYDTGGSVEGARQAAQKVLSDDVHLVLGPVFAESVRAVKPIIATKNINMIAFSTDWSLAGQNTFLMGFLPFDQVDRIVSFAAQRDIKRIGIVVPNSDYGRIVSSIFREVAAQRGVRVTAEIQLPVNNTDLGDSIRQFMRIDGGEQTDKSALPFDAVLMPVGGEAAVTVSNLLTRYGAPPDIVQRLGTGVFDDPRLLGEPGLKGAWFAAPAPSLRLKFEEEFKSIYGYMPPRLSTLAYDSTALSAVLAQRAPSGNMSDAFSRTYIMNPNGFSGIDGIFRFRSNGVAERGLAVLEIKDSRIYVLDPALKSFKR